MVNNMIEFYKEHLTTYSLIFKYFKRQYRMFQFTLLFGVLGIMSISLLVGFRYYICAFMLFVFILAISSYMIHKLNFNSKKVLAERYKIFVDKGIWRVESFEIVRSEIIIEYLCSQQLFNSKNINLIIQLLEKELKRRKIQSFIKPGFVLAFLTPIWVQFLLVLYKYANDPSSAFSLMATISILVYFIIYFGGMARYLYSEIKDFLFSNDSIYIKDLIILLEDCLLRYPDYLAD